MPDVKVINHNSFPLKGRFASQDYFFPAGGSATVPEKAAEHIFALNEEREKKTGALNRLGLLCGRPGDTLEKAYEALDNMEFHMGQTVFETPEPMPPPQEQPIGDNPGAPRSPGGESEPEAGSSPLASGPDALAREVLARRAKRGAPSGG